MVRNRMEKEDLVKLISPANNNFVNFSVKEKSVTIGRLVLGLFVFVAGVMIGLSSSSNFGKFLSSGPELLYSNDVISKENKIDSFTLENLVLPKDLGHNMTDEELIWRASMVPKIGKYPFKRVPKVAFMFLTKGPLPFLPLWERFFAGHEGKFSIYVHAMPGFTLNVSSDSVFFGRQIPSQAVSWGTISLIDAEKRLLANALLDFSNERFILRSESCIPLYDFPTIYKYLTESSHSFVESYDDPTHDGRGRYNHRMAPTITLDQWRKGSQWLELNRDLAIETISEYKYYYLFKRFCHPPCFSDEHYIPTYLYTHRPSLISNRTLTWVTFPPESPHPALFKRGDITETFLQSIRDSGKKCSYNSKKTTVCYLFARKFDPSALDPLLDLSSKVMGF